MPRNMIIYRLHILVIIIYRLCHCWHASYKECLCPGQLGCVFIIRISSGLPGVQKHSRQDRIVCPLHPFHSKHIVSLCTTERVYEWISAATLTRYHFNVYRSLAWPLNMQSPFFFFFFFLVCRVSYNFLVPVCPTCIHWQVLDVPGHARGFNLPLLTWTHQKWTCIVMGV